MKDKAPSKVTLEGAEPRTEAWPEVSQPTPEANRVVYPGVYPGAGSELFHGKKT